MRCSWRSPMIRSRLASSRTVTSLSSGVIARRTGSFHRVSNRRSREVTMPTSRSPSTTGTPEILRRRVSSTTCPMVVSGPTVIGSRTTPLSNFFTLRTLSAWTAGGRFRWTMPIPPSSASAMASRASVTMSIAADTMGMLSGIPGGEDSGKVGVAGEDLGVAGRKHHIVEGERFFDVSHRHLALLEVPAGRWTRSLS